VGKSSLLNALTGERISIVEPTAGVTRDRVSAIVEFQGRYFELIDTGGYGIVDSDELSDHVEWQIHQAIEKADLVLFVTDVREGIMPLDKTIAKLLRKQNLNVILVANKADSSKQSADAGEFTRLGYGEALCVSATNFVNQSKLKELILEELDHMPNDVPEETTMKFAVVGKRNAGKSTLINAIAGENRVIVSEIPGTTRDAIDVRFERNDQVFLAIDTAGVRKQRKMENDIEYYGFTRAMRSIKRADVVLFLVDATLKISQVDKKLAMIITEECKACIFVINKWDLVEGKAYPHDYGDYILEMLPALKYAPLAFTQANTGKGVDEVLDLTADIFKQTTTNVSTAVLNKAIAKLSEERIGVAKKKKGLPRIYYGTQVSNNPVTILLFVNKPDLFDEGWKRFAAGRLREALGIEEVPIRLLFRARR
jgi:GTP-binding protein